MEKIEISFVIKIILLRYIILFQICARPEFVEGFPRAIESIHWHSIKCLSQSTYFLSRFCEQHYSYKPCNITEQSNCIQIDSIHFFHPKIQKCLKQLMQTKSLKPLLYLLKQTQHASIISPDNLFFHELFMLIFTVHKQILFNECAECSYTLKATTFETIIEISDKINQLPIAEVLNAINMLVIELPPFLEKYEFNSKLTWKVWFKKYWWVLPVFGAWFGLKILLNLQRNHFYYTTYLPRPQIPLQPIVITEVTNPVLVELDLKKEPLQI